MPQAFRDKATTLPGWARRWELPTWALIATIYGGWLSVTWYWTALPLCLAAPALAWLCAWHMSFQHEAIHQHPTRLEWLNTLLACPPLTLWLPYPLYRESHRQHHQDSRLTDPLEDPESTYMCPQRWAAAGPLRRFLHTACNTFLGRLLLGPPHNAALLWLRQARGIARGERRLGLWAAHLAFVALILGWTTLICRMHPAAYLLCGAYGGTMLGMIRSLAEHRAAARPEDRTAVVEQAGLLGLLFLNNNLHVLHQARPGVPWYDLPALWRQSREEMLRGRNGPIYAGYRDIAARYLLRPHHPGPHPLTDAAAAGALGPARKRIHGLCHPESPVPSGAKPAGHVGNILSNALMALFSPRRAQETKSF